MIDKVNLGPVGDFAESHPRPRLLLPFGKMPPCHLGDAEVSRSNVEDFATVHRNRLRFLTLLIRVPRPPLRRGSTIGAANGDNDDLMNVFTYPPNKMPFIFSRNANLRRASVFGVGFGVCEFYGFAIDLRTSVRHEI